MAPADAHEPVVLEPSIQTPDEPDPGLGGAAEERRRAEIGNDVGLRRRTARGTIVNGVFLAGINLLGILKGVLVASFLTVEEYGIWGILLITVIAMLTLKQVGIGEKYVQQDEADQQKAFERAFTNELIVSGAAMVLLLASMPLVSLAYGEPEVLVPGLVMTLAVPALAMQVPIWIFYRRMQFLRQRVLQAIDPVVSFAVTIGLAIAGYGFWSLVIGTVVGGWAAAAAALAFSPLKPGIRIERDSLKSYFRFSWPLMLVTVSGLAMAQGSLLVGKLALGLSAVGAIALASQISLYATKLDEIITQSLYPAICAVKEKSDMLRDVFLKSNRIAILWGVPFGACAAIFASDLITYVLGEKWRFAETLIQATAIVAAINQVGFNWNAFFQAQNDTRPLAVAAVTMTVAMGALALPLLAAEGLTGFAVGLGAAAMVQLAVRIFYLRRMFPGLPILSNALSAARPSLIAVAVVLPMRIAMDDRTGFEALVQFGTFAVVVVAATLLFERRLFTEILGYAGLRRRAAETSPSAV